MREQVVESGVDSTLVCRGGIAKSLGHDSPCKVTKWRGNGGKVLGLGVVPCLCKTIG